MNKKKRVLLIMPSNVTVIEPFRSAKRKHAALVPGFPIGLGYIAASLRKDDKYDVKIADGAQHEYSIDDFCDIIREYDPHYIGMTVYTVTSKVAVALARRIKEDFKNKVVIAGGPHASDDYKTLLTKYPFFDFIVIGEGEVTMADLLGALDSGDTSRLREICGLAYTNTEGETVLTGERELLRKIDEIPPPSRDLVDFDDYIIRDNLLPYSIEILGSRGCTHRCAFCSFQKKWRPRDPEAIAQEMKDLVRRYPRIKSFLFFDDNFSANRKRVEKLCHVLIREGLNKYMWSCLCRADQVTPDLLALMKEAGCTKICFGVESGCPEILKNLNKQLDLDCVKPTFEAATKAGIDAMAFFIFGGPGETRDTINTTYQFAKELDCRSTTWGLVSVYPGTRLAEMQPCEDFVAYLYEPELQNPGTGGLSANIPVFDNPELDRETLKAIFLRLRWRIVIYKALMHPLFTLKKLRRDPKIAGRFLSGLLATRHRRNR